MLKQSATNIDQEHIWHPFTSLRAIQPLKIVKGKGPYVITEDGREILDVISSWWVNIHGHANKEISEAVARQAMELEHVIFAGFTHQPAIDITEKLMKVLPDNIQKLFFSDDGSTAVEVGIKMALQYWHNRGEHKKKKIIAWEGAYHGDTFGAMSVAERNAFSAPFNSYLFDVTFLPFPDENNYEEVIGKFTNEVKSGEAALFIFEPLVQGAAGMRTYSPELLDELIGIAKEHDVLCMADEVFTGFYRTGKMFAIDYLENKPDIITLSKGLTGGYLPLSITACSKDIVKEFDTDESLKTFYHGHSYTANPLACAAANASFELLIKEECQNQIQMITRLHTDFLHKIKDHDKVKDARVLGTILAIELKSNKASSYFNDMRDVIYRYFMKKDIMMRPLGNTIYMVPPYAIEEEDLSRCYYEINNFLHEEL